MMIDTKSQEMSSVPPPAYPAAQPTQPPPQWQPPVRPPQMLTAAQLGEQYRAAQFAQCAQGNHSRETKYGVCGIITAVILFPIGLVCLFMDTHDECTRCGNRL